VTTDNKTNWWTMSDRNFHWQAREKSKMSSNPQIRKSYARSWPVAYYWSDESARLHCICYAAVVAVIHAGRRIEREKIIQNDCWLVLLTRSGTRTVVNGWMCMYSLRVSISGYVELKNWKRLPVDLITDNARATVEEVLGDLIPMATICIRLSCRWANKDWI
jgi:Ubiquitin-like oligomerisation domain of SATB